MRAAHLAGAPMRSNPVKSRSLHRWPATPTASKQHSPSRCIFGFSMFLSSGFTDTAALTQHRVRVTIFFYKKRRPPNLDRWEAHRGGLAPPRLGGPPRDGGKGKQPVVSSSS